MNLESIQRHLNECEVTPQDQKEIFTFLNCVKENRPYGKILVIAGSGCNGKSVFLSKLDELPLSHFRDRRDRDLYQDHREKMSFRLVECYGSEAKELLSIANERRHLNLIVASNVFDFPEGDFCVVRFPKDFNNPTFSLFPNQYQPSGLL